MIANCSRVIKLMETTAKEPGVNFYKGGSHDLSDRYIEPTIIVGATK